MNTKNTLKQFYRDCYDIANKDPFPIKDKKAINCMIQAFRYVLRSYTLNYGARFVIGLITSDRKTNFFKHYIRCEWCGSECENKKYCSNSCKNESKRADHRWMINVEDIKKEKSERQSLEDLDEVG